MPDTTNAAKLLEWAWDNRHQLTADASYPNGKAVDLSRVYFDVDGYVIARLALPHPLAVLVDGRTLPFSPTIDANLIQNFHPSEIHLETQPDALALVELSPVDKTGTTAGLSIKDRVASGEFVIDDPMQRWCADHRVVLRRPPLRDGFTEVLPSEDVLAFERVARQ
jgi:hypothetical protein